MRQRKTSVPVELVERIDHALATVDAARERCHEVERADADLSVRRAASRDLRLAYDAAERLLREATRLAKADGYHRWRPWRHRLSVLTTARANHLLAEHDEIGLLPWGSVRAVDTGMSGPDVGDLLHGRSRAPGSPAEYGVDVATALGWAPPAPAPPVLVSRREEDPGAPEATYPLAG